MDSSEIMDILKPNDYDKNARRYRKIRVVVVSDSHNDHEMIEVPSGDIFLHCGDFTNRHDWQNLSYDQVPQSIINFNEWLGKLPHKYKIVICGNHEIGFSKLSNEEIASKYLTNCIYLKDQLIEIEGIKIYGCPWPFNEKFQSKWPLIPSHIDILMTHIPPQFILDLAFQPKKSSSKQPCSMCNDEIHSCYGHWGSGSLRKEIVERIQPRIHCFGHVHDDFGYKYDQYESGTCFINAAGDLTKRSIQFNFYVDLQKY